MFWSVRLCPFCFTKMLVLGTQNWKKLILLSLLCLISYDWRLWNTLKYIIKNDLITATYSYFSRWNSNKLLFIKLVLLKQVEPNPNLNTWTLLLCNCLNLITFSYIYSILFNRYGLFTQTWSWLNETTSNPRWWSVTNK